MQFLASILSDGEMHATEVKKDCRGTGYSVSTMNRAKKQLGVQAKKVGIGKGSYWVWEIPTTPKILNNAKDIHSQSLRTFGEIEHLKANIPYISQALDIVEGTL